MPTLADDIMAGRPIGTTARSMAFAERAVEPVTVATGQTPTLATGDTVACNRSTLYRFTTAGAITGVLMDRGVTHGQLFFLLNTSANSLTFASSATSLVADGANVTIPANRMGIFIWDGLLSLWTANESTT